MRKRRMSWWALGASVALVAAACGGGGEKAVQESAVVEEQPVAAAEGPSAQEEAVEPTPLEIVTVDFAFDFNGASSVPAGPVEVFLENQGAQHHHAQFFKLNDGVTYEEFRKAVKKDRRLSGDLKRVELSTIAGGIAHAVRPGTSQHQTSELEPGLYAVMCSILDIDSSKPHHALGMIAPFRVE